MPESLAGLKKNNDIIFVSLSSCKRNRLAEGQKNGECGVEVCACIQLYHDNIVIQNRFSRIGFFVCI